MSNFDHIAPVYDRLASLVYGKAIKDAQRVHLPAIRSAKSVLILGGGTGWLLQDVLALNPDLHIVYVEASARMIELARRQVDGANLPRVDFRQGTEEMLRETPQFDAILANFYLDLFNSQELSPVINRLKRTLLPSGKILCTDFVNHTWWQMILLGLMYKFFRFAAGLKNQHLPQWRKGMEAEGFIRISSRSFWNGFIYGDLYAKG